MVLETPMAFTEKIAETLGVKIAVVDELFNIDEDRNGYFVAKLNPKKFLDKAQFRALCTLVKDLKGEDYLEGAKAWKVPGPLAKVPRGSSTPKNIPAPIPKTSPTEVLDEDTEVLRGSAKKIGHLYPILVDSQDNVIDGFHRLKADPTWPKFKVNRVDGPVELEIARLVANTRRDVPAEEKTKGLKAIVEMTGWSPKQLAENIGWSIRTIYQYLPTDLKDSEPEELARARVARGMEKTESSTTLKPQDITVGKAKELLDTPAGKEVLAEAVKEAVAKGEVPASDDDEPLPEPSLTSPSESIPKTHEPVKESVPSPTAKPRLKSEEIDTGFEFCCPECQDKFQILHVKHPDGKVEHRLEAKY